MKHVHRYMRIKMQNKKIWRCSLPDCTHYLQHEMAVGQRSVCWVCGEEMILTPTIMLRVKPHCDNGRCFTRPSIAKNIVEPEIEDWKRIIEEAS